MTVYQRVWEPRLPELGTLSRDRLARCRSDPLKKVPLTSNDDSFRYAKIQMDSIWKGNNWKMTCLAVSLEMSQDPWIENGRIVETRALFESFETRVFGSGPARVLDVSDLQKSNRIL